MQFSADLSYEVVEWCQSGKLLAGAQPQSDLVFEHSDGQISVDLRNVDDWFDSTDIENEETPYVELMNFAENVRAAELAMFVYGAKQIRRALFDISDQIHKSVVESPNVSRLAKRLFETRPRGMDFEEVTAHLQTTIIDELMCVISARTVTRSRCYVPGEAMFHAYKLGLLPFGWNYEDDSLWCLDPARM